MAGAEIDDQEMNSAAPASTAGHAGTRITTAYPAMATRFTTASARFAPKRSDR